MLGLNVILLVKRIAFFSASYCDNLFPDIIIILIGEMLGDVMVEAKWSLEKVQAEAERWEGLKRELGKVVFGQDEIITKLCIGLLCNGHILLEGVPGLAKTTLVKSFAKSLGLSFSRIQFTPDLLPSDVIGSTVYNPHNQTFDVRKGPIFAGVVLADEINRAPAKVQSALLEAMEEHQVTIGSQSFRLDYPLIVLATQNPLDQEGTYVLPEAQTDRFMFKLLLTYPSRASEKSIVTEKQSFEHLNMVLNQAEILDCQKAVSQVFVDSRVVDYILDIVTSTRMDSKRLPEMSKMLKFGASPRASLALVNAAKAHAFLKKRDFVTPDDVKFLAADVLRHRIILTYQAEVDGLTADRIIAMILDSVVCP